MRPTSVCMCERGGPVETSVASWHTPPSSVPTPALPILPCPASAAHLSFRMLFALYPPLLPFMLAALSLQLLLSPPPTPCCACTSVPIVIVIVVVVSHPFSCGQETRVIPRILQLRSHWLKSEKESLRLQEAGITKEVMNSAIAQFCLEIIAKHGEPAPRLCNKDPLTLKMGSYVIELFPNVSRSMPHASICIYICLFVCISCRPNSCSWCEMAGPPYTRLYPAR